MSGETFKSILWGGDGMNWETGITYVLCMYKGDN